MSSFLSDLWTSVFTPGPTPTLIVATNVSFAALQLVLLALLLLTYSIHFIILSLLCAALWVAINWFVRELQAANAKEREAKEIREHRKEEIHEDNEDSGTETEAVGDTRRIEESKRRSEIHMSLHSGNAVLRKRPSLGSTSGDMSTDSEWDKVEEGDLDR